MNDFVLTISAFYVFSSEDAGYTNGKINPQNSRSILFCHFFRILGKL